MTLDVAQIPIFPSGGFDETVAFYGHLEFSEQNRFEDEYLILTHTSGLELHFFPANVKPRINDHGAYARFSSLEDLDGLYARWNGRCNTPAFARVAGKVGRLAAAVDTDYGLREFALIDHDGNLLRLGASLA